MECKNPSCKIGQGDGKLCPDCESDLEKAVEISLMNFAPADWFYCGICGGKYSKEELINHLNRNLNGEYSC